MHARDEKNASSPSTTWEWKRVKMRRPPEAGKHEAASGRRWYLRHPKDMREPVTLTVRYRGGAEAWWEIEARGQIIRRPGHVAIHDLFKELHGQR